MNPPLTDVTSGARRATVEQSSRPPEDWIVRYYLRPTIPGSQWSLVDTSRYERQEGAAVAAEHFLAGGGSDLR